MNIFKVIVAFFRKDSVKAILEIGKKLLSIFVQKAAGELERTASEEVWKAEQTGKTGTEKYEMAYKGIKARFPELKESIINLALEIACNWLTASKT